MLTRVSNIEAYRKWMNWTPLHDDDVEPTVEDFIRFITTDEPTEAMKVGTVPVREVKKSGPKEGSKAQAKPCPVTGVLNTHRRFSYLMPEARTPENLAKYKKGK